MSVKFCDRDHVLVAVLGPEARRAPFRELSETSGDATPSFFICAPRLVLMWLVKRCAEGLIELGSAAPNRDLQYFADVPVTDSTFVDDSRFRSRIIAKLFSESTYMRFDVSSSVGVFLTPTCPKQFFVSNYPIGVS